MSLHEIGIIIKYFNKKRKNNIEFVGILLGKLSASFNFSDEEVQDAYILKHAQLFLLTYCNLNQTASLMQGILADANPGTISSFIF